MNKGDSFVAVSRDSMDVNLLFMLYLGHQQDHSCPHFQDPLACFYFQLIDCANILFYLSAHLPSSSEIPLIHHVQRKSFVEPYKNTY